MKKILLFLFIYTTTEAFSQRYLTSVYPQIDSIIGGVYGTAINYQSVNQNLVYDFYAPTSDTAQKRPLIIYIHGGGFTTGTRSYPSVKLLCRRMAMKGYAVANIDYRLDPNFQLYNSNTNRRAMTDAMHDAKQAIRYFKANAGLFKLDTNKIFIGGESAGATTAMMASYVDKQSEMTIYPMANPNNPIGSNSNASFSNNIKATMCLCGMILDTSAIENKDNTSLLWTHSTADDFVPLFLAFNVVLRAKNIGIPIQTRLYQGGLHCPWYYGNPNWQSYLDSTITDITTFLYPKVNTTVRAEDLNALESSIKTYPNPANNVLNIDLEAPYKKVNIALITTSGQIQTKWAFKDLKQLALDLSEIENGLYFIKIELDNNTFLTRKIRVEKK